MNSIRLFLFFLVYMTFSPLFGQDDPAKIHEEINREIWQPFTEAYNNYDGEAFNALHSEDVVRASPWGLRVGAEYKQSNLENYHKGKEAGNKRSIYFWLEHRQTNSQISYEVGYYKITTTTTEGSRNYYARFHVVIRKIDGRWKIVQDWDTNSINGRKVTAEDFEKGKDQVLEF